MQLHRLQSRRRRQIESGFKRPFGKLKLRLAAQGYIITPAVIAGNPFWDLFAGDRFRFRVIPAQTLRVYPEEASR